MLCWMPRARHDLIVLSLMALVGFGSCAHAAAAPTAGELLYRRGTLLSGQPVHGEREAGAGVDGADAACSNCHRRSGLGSKEGLNSIPPITGRYLFMPRATSPDDMAVPFVEGARPDRDPYTDDTLARAIREGIGADGQPLSYLMPRYRLDDADMAALVSYLKGMTPGPVPGVTDSVLHFATIITPDANPVERQGMLDVLEKYFFDKNAAVRSASPRLYSSRKMMFRVTRRWQLHVWELTGGPQTWEAQLRRHLAEEPVFAVISGLGGKTWAPVQHFCEQQSLPCLFPNVDLPNVEEGEFYSVYFSKGVLLEALLIAQQIGSQDDPSAPRRLVQIYRPGDVGEAAAEALQAATLRAAGALQAAAPRAAGAPRAANGGRGLKFVTRALKRAGGSQDLAAALEDVGPGDALILWLRADDIASLAAMPVKASAVWMSGLMGGLEKAPLPAAWRSTTRMAYPFDLPEKRRVRVDYALGWFSIRHIPVVAPRVQADTYLACGLVAETLSHMVDTFVRDYLVERIETGLDHRIITGYYPRLTLAPGQRFASKGGYIVRFADPVGPKVVAVSDWVVPR
jgi:Cytochrome c